MPLGKKKGREEIHEKPGGSGELMGPFWEQK